MISIVHLLYYQILESSKDSSFQVKLVFFFSLKYCAWQCSFSPMFYGEDVFDDIKQYIYLIFHEELVGTSLIHKHF